MRRRQFLAAALGSATALATRSLALGQEATRPNVVLIMTDDQGYGDMSCHGNPKLKTPNHDRLCAEGVEFTRFYVCPVCAPTRACLMTGRYNYRTGVTDTYLGRAMMHGEETTVAEMLRDAGYATGIFGKWHLGDNVPLRPEDQGFAEVLVHNGGGIGQPSDPPGSGYFDPTLRHNGVWGKHKGYCTDVFFNAALAFIEKNRDKPFFAYIPTNAPHGPFIVAEELWKPYKAMGLDDKTAKVYGMVKNIDDNIGRLLAKLDELKLAENTLVIFLTDNGPNGRRHNCGLRGAKGSVYEGGIRTAFFARWPARLKAGRKVAFPGAHIDMLPTLLSICRVPLPAAPRLDGMSLLPFMLGAKVDMPERTLYLQWHRGDVPQPFRACAAVGERYKLINGNQLYDLSTDPAESKNIAAEHPEIVSRMRAGYEAWFKDVSSTRGYAPPRIHIGTPLESPTTLTRQDWRGPRAGWGGQSLGHWEVKVATAGKYRVKLRFRGARTATEAHFRFGKLERTVAVEKGASSCTFEGVELPEGNGRLEAWLALKKPMGVNYVDVALQK